VATYEKWAKVFKTWHQYMDSIPVHFGDAKDASLTWDGTNLTLKPLVDDTGAFVIGDGTTDMDFKVFMNTSAKYVLFDQSAAAVTLVATTLTMGADTTGTDFKLFGTTTGNYLLWDASEDDLTLVGTATQLSVAGTTESTSTTTGSLRTAGGFATGGDCYLGDDVFLTSAAKLDWAAGNVTLTHSTGALACTGALTISIATATTSATTGALIVTGGIGTAAAIWVGTTSRLVGNVQMDGTLIVGNDAAGRDFTLYGAVTAYKAWWDADGDTNGMMIFGADTKGVDVKAFGATTGNYLLWDASADDLLLVGTATQLAVAGTTASSSTTTGSLRTAGGLGVVGDAYFGGRLDVTATAVHATTGRVGKFTATVAAPNQGDGYGVFEVDVTASGTFAGTTNAFSSWLNVAADAVPGANMLCAQNNGIYLPSGITASSAKMIMGMRMHYVADDGANPGSLFLFGTNIYSNVLTALFDVNAIVDMGGSTGAQTGNDYKIPLFKDASAGQLWYVNVYHT